MPKSTTIRIRLRDFLRLQRYAEKHDINENEAFGIAVKRLEAKKLEKIKLEFDECDECGYKMVPKDATFCPNCGIEFAIEDKDESEDEDEDEEEEE
jgi:predicted Zn-ribbon and HTH transcriptional regulator